MGVGLYVGGQGKLQYKIEWLDSTMLPKTYGGHVGFGHLQCVIVDATDRQNFIQ